MVETLRPTTFFQREMRWRETKGLRFRAEMSQWKVRDRASWLSRLVSLSSFESLVLWDSKRVCAVETGLFFHLRWVVELKGPNGSPVEEGSSLRIVCVNFCRIFMV